MRLKVISFIGAGFMLLCLLLLFTVLLHPAVAEAGTNTPAAFTATPTLDELGRLPNVATPQAAKRFFLPMVRGSVRPIPTAPPDRILNPTCWWFPLGPSGSDDVECSATQGLVIQRNNISFTMVACCGTSGAKHYAVMVDVSRTAGEGDYRIGFDVRSLVQGGGYLFGVNPDTRSYSLIRVDNSNWKGGISLIPWTVSDKILPGAAVNRLQIERRGPTILLAINGQQVAAVQDTTWLDQGIGWTLYARNYQAGGAVMRFENIRCLQWNDIPTR
ncbi:MAG: hypothetical protein NT169_26725 [Chloroflexi bacterium]|nr:hypothetical protein [Chloroflexota bacterium]